MVLTPSITGDVAFEEKQIARGQGDAVGPALGILIADFDLAPHYWLNADQLPALLAKLSKAL